MKWIQSLLWSLCMGIPVLVNAQSLSLSQKRVIMDISDEILDRYIRLCDFRDVGDESYSDVARDEFLELFEDKAQIFNDICPGEGNQAITTFMTPQGYADAVKKQFPGGLRSFVTRAHYVYDEMDAGRLKIELEKEVSGETTGKSGCGYKNVCRLRMTIDYTLGLDSFRISGIERVHSNFQKFGCAECSQMIVRGERLIHTVESEQVTIKGPVTVECDGGLLGEYGQITVIGEKITVSNDSTLVVHRGVQVHHQGRVVHDFPKAKCMVRGKLGVPIHRGLYLAPMGGLSNSRLITYLPSFLDDESRVVLRSNGMRLGADIGIKVGKTWSVGFGLMPSLIFNPRFLSSSDQTYSWTDSSCSDCVLYDSSYYAIYSLYGGADTVRFGTFEIPVYVGVSRLFGPAEKVEVFAHVGLGVAFPLGNSVSSGAYGDRIGYFPGMDWPLGSDPNDPVVEEYGFYNGRPVSGKVENWLKRREIFGLLHIGAWYNWSTRLAFGGSAYIRKGWTNLSRSDESEGVPQLSPSGDYASPLRWSEKVSYHAWAIMVGAKVSVLEF